MGNEGLSVFDDISRVQARKTEERELSLREEVTGIADMVEGNRVLQERVESKRKEQIYGDSPLRNELASYSKELGVLRERKLGLQELIPQRKKQLEGFKENLKGDLDAYAELLERAEEEIRALEKELESIPQQEKDMETKCEKRRALDEEMRKAYDDIEGGHSGYGVEFAVDTTFAQMNEAGTPLTTPKEELVPAVKRELADRQERRRIEAEERRSRELQERETAWLAELERTLAREQARIEGIIEEKARFLRGETAEGQKFIAGITDRYRRTHQLLNAWALRDKTKQKNATDARTLGQEINAMLEAEENALGVDLYNEILASWNKMTESRAEPYGHTLGNYPMEGHAYRSMDTRTAMADKVTDIRDRVNAFRREMNTRREELRPLLKNIRLLEREP